MIAPLSLNPFDGSSGTAGSNAADPTTPTGSSTDPSTGPNSSTASDATPTTNELLQPNQFLTLLVDNLKYQDPLDPTSSADFLSELAELSQVETLQQLAQTEQSASQVSELANSAALIGDSVTGTDPNGNAVSGTVTGVSQSNADPVLEIGNTTLPLSDVTTLTAASPSGGPSPSGGADPSGGASGSPTN